MNIYISETEFSKDKPIYLAIADIYGLGFSTSKLISKKLGFLPNLKTKYLTQDQVIILKKTITNLNITLAGDLKKIRSLNTKRLILIKSYKGLRIIQGLPIRGQRTHSNAKTARKHNKQK
jgi:small subunit ribosomal protein S13